VTVYRKKIKYHDSEVVKLDIITVLNCSASLKYRAPLSPIPF